MSFLRSTGMLALLLASAPEAMAQRRAPRACAAELGAAAAQRLVQDCKDANPAAPALCRPETPCDALRQMIAEACRTPGAETKSACRDIDDDEDDEDEDE